MTPTPEECAIAAWEWWQQDQIETPPEEPPMTRRDVARFSINLAANLSPEEIDAIEDAGSRDRMEGPEWLPWYKAALSALAELVGCMTKWLEAGRKPTPEAVAAMKRLWKLHMLLGGIGPESDAPDAARRRAFAEGETNAAFFVLEGGEKQP